MERREREALDRYLTTEPGWRTDEGDDVHEEITTVCPKCGREFDEHPEQEVDTPDGGRVINYLCPDAGEVPEQFMTHLPWH